MMEQKDAAYHKAAIAFNQTVVDFARDVAKTADHKEVVRWAKAMEKKHQHYLSRHEESLRRLEASANREDEN